MLLVADGEHQVQVLEYGVGLGHAVAQMAQGGVKGGAGLVYLGEQGGQAQGVGQRGAQVVGDDVGELLQIAVVPVQVLRHLRLARLHLLAVVDVLQQGYEVSHRSGLVADGGDVHGQPELFPRLLVVEDGNRKRFPALQAFADVPHGGRVGVGARQQRVQPLVQHLGQGVAGVAGEGVIHPLRAPGRVGNDHAVVGAAGHQGQQPELLLGLHPFADIRKVNGQPCDRRICLHFKPVILALEIHFEPHRLPRINGLLVVLAAGAVRLLRKQRPKIYPQRDLPADVHEPLGLLIDVVQVQVFIQRQKCIGNAFQRGG